MNENERLRAALEAARIPHHQCDGDPWYSCPKSEEGHICPDDSKGLDCTCPCNCGADEHNARIDEALAKYIISADKAAPGADESCLVVMAKCETREEAQALCRQLDAAPDLLAACKTGLELYDELAVETNPLACAARHGPDYEPPSWQEWNEMCLEVRGILQAAIAKAEGQPPPS